MIAEDRPPLSASRSARDRSRLIAFGLGALAIGLGAPIGALIAWTLAGLLADALDIGYLKDRLAFAAMCGALGAPVGSALAFGLFLAARGIASRLVAASAMLVALAGALGLAAYAFGFVISTAPPPQLAWLVADIRLTPGAPAGAGTPDVRAASGTESREPAHLSVVKDAAGRDLIHVAFPISRQAPIASLHLHREGQQEIRFSLNLPSDPPSTADFTHWLTADGPSYGGESAELRFRIERRVSR